MRVFQHYWLVLSIAISVLPTSGCLSGRHKRNTISYTAKNIPAAKRKEASARSRVTLASHSPALKGEEAVVGETLPLKLGGSAPSAMEVGLHHNNGARGGSSQKLPVEAYVAQALSSNPRIHAFKHRIASLKNRIPQARALPDPKLQETFWPFNGNALETAGGRAANQIGISQQVPWPEKLRAKATVACREVQIAYEELRQEELDIAEAVGLACLEIWYADEAISAVDEFGELVKQLNEASEARYRSAAKGSGQQDVLRAQIEGDRLEDRRVLLQQQKQLAQADLATLLHDPQFSRPEVSKPFQQNSLSTQLEELIGLAGSCNPSLAGVEAEIARDRAKQNLACLQQYPDFQLGANWLIVSDNNALSPVATGNDNFGFTFGLSLPVWRDKINAGIAEANHQSQVSANRLESRKDAIARKLRRLVAQFDASTEQLRILEERILPRTEDALEISLVNYAGNRADFPAVVDLYEERLMLELQKFALRKNQHAILIKIQAIVGCDTQ